MWYATELGDISVEPVLLVQARAQCSLMSWEVHFDVQLKQLISAARAAAEAFCNVRFATRTAVMRCDSFADFVRLPDAPVREITTVSYLDTDGVTHVLAPSVYEARLIGLEPSIVLGFGQQWPAIRSGSRIEVAAVVGFAKPPDDAVQAMLRHIDDGFRVRETTEAAGWTTFHSLLSNHMRGS